MSRLAMVLLVSGLGMGGLYAAAAADTKVVVAIQGWGKFIDLDGDCRVALEGPKLKLGVPATPHDFAAELKRWNAPRVLRPVNGDFVAQVKTSGTFRPKAGSTIDGRKPYNGAGILLVADNEKHANLQRAAPREKGRVRHYLNSEVRHAGELQSARFDMDIPDADCWLRLERRGGDLYAMTSDDGVNWKSYEPLKIKMPERLKIGVEAVNSASAPFECACEKFSLFRRVGADEDIQK